MSPRQGKWSLSRAHNSTVTGSARRSIFQSSLEDRLRFGAPGQVSWLSDRPTPRAFPASRPVARAGFVPDYSDGGAAGSHPLPWAPPGPPGANGPDASRPPQPGQDPTHGTRKTTLPEEI